MDGYNKESEEYGACPPLFPEELTTGVKEMVVKENTKFDNIFNYVNKIFADAECRRIIFSGIGEASAKCISCVEVYKRNYKDGKLYQWNKVVFRQRTDTWKPVVPNMRVLLTFVDLPSIYILISKDPFPEQYINESCQSSIEIRQAELLSQDSKSEVLQFRSRQRKRKLLRLLEPNRWNRPLKKVSKLLKKD
ncbi:unnamed protein product [Thelazia callipaeda]|uniref:Alba domain-containing protein n=1 Tax=Thelazia callipaeda TaxID=103827 RepID=A0A158RC91_THECL|nr:unnamed protein product [Thelazia callipaeda]